MALIQCEECGNQISDKATVCPHCGCPQEPVEEEVMNTPDDRMDEMPNVKLWVTVALVAFVLIGAFMSCPGKDKHREAIDEVCNDAMTELAASESSNPFAGFAAAFGGSLVSSIVSNFIDVDSYGICSIGKLKVPGQDERIVTFGAFGHVFPLVSGEDISKKISEKTK